jgi:hypothetical protein
MASVRAPAVSRAFASSLRRSASAAVEESEVMVETGLRIAWM